MAKWFMQFAQRASNAAGHYLTFLVAVALIVGWAATGPFFGFSETWQLVVNTATTIVTFLMVFLIQNTQNRDALAMQLKLDEIIRAIEGADNAFIMAEEATTDELEDLRRRYETLYAAHKKLKARLEVDEANGRPDLTLTERDAPSEAPGEQGSGQPQAGGVSLADRSSKSEMTATFAAEAEAGSNS
jgi:low affinity Fe/Cu permease